jgi:hypothetical protein
LSPTASDAPNQGWSLATVTPSPRIRAKRTVSH